MQFNKLVIISNFPYQQQTEDQKLHSGSKSLARPIYHSFIECMIDTLNPDYFTTICPSKWMNCGMGLGEFRTRMMNDRHISKIVHFGGIFEIFSSVEIKGGVSYWLWQKDYNGECEFVHDNISVKRYLNTHDIIIQDNNALPILEKVQSKCNKWVSDKCYANTPFGLATNFSNWSDVGLTCYCRGKEIHLVDLSNINDKNNILDKWKVCVSAANGSAQEYNRQGLKKVLSDIFIIEPNSVCTETYIVVSAFDNKSHAENFLLYMKTKVFRYMLGLRVLTQSIYKDKFSWVPDMEHYDKIWTNTELYQYFELRPEDISYIESKIKTL